MLPSLSFLTLQSGLVGKKRRWGARGDFRGPGAARAAPAQVREETSICQHRRVGTTKGLGTRKEQAMSEPQHVDDGCITLFKDDRQSQGTGRTSHRLQLEAGWILGKGDELKLDGRSILDLSTSRDGCRTLWRSQLLDFQPFLQFIYNQKASLHSELSFDLHSAANDMPVSSAKRASVRARVSVTFLELLHPSSISSSSRLPLNLGGCMRQVLVQLQLPVERERPFYKRKKMQDDQNQARRSNEDKESRNVVENAPTICSADFLEIEVWSYSTTNSFYSVSRQSIQHYLVHSYLLEQSNLLVYLRIHFHRFLHPLLNLFIGQALLLLATLQGLDLRFDKDTSWHELPR